MPSSASCRADARRFSGDDTHRAVGVKAIRGARFDSRAGLIVRLVLTSALVLLLPSAQRLDAADDPGWVAVNVTGAAIPAVPAAAGHASSTPDSVPPAPAWSGSSGCGARCADLVTQVRRPIALPALYASLGVVQGLDLYSTAKALRYGAHEANPLMAGIVNNRAASIAMKAGTSAALIYVAERLRKKSPAAAVTMMAVVNGVTAAVAIHNFRNARVLAARQR
jgi:hypothetical protein